MLENSSSSFARNVKRQRRFFDLILILIVGGLLISANPVCAALQAHTFSGTISSLDTGRNQVEIQTESGTFSGEAPNEYIFDVLSNGDSVIAVSLGSKGGQWVFIGRLKADEKTLTDAFGDISYLPPDNCDDSEGKMFCDFDIAGQHQFQYNNAPSCDECSGCNCDASKTTLTISDSAGQKIIKNLLPGESFTHEGQEYKIDVIFISGETNAYPECSDQMCAGPQPVSNFVVNIIANNNKKMDNDDSDSSCFISTIALENIAL